MLKVPSVDATVKYWTDKGGTIRASRAKDELNTANGCVELRSAFVELGCLKSSSKNKNDVGGEKPVSFALELVATNKKNVESYSIGNAISYIGVSMLLQFQNNLLGAIQGESPQAQGEEPNGIPVQSSASAPGDLLARIAFKSNNLQSTHQFYTDILGMDAKAQDDDMVCLRYDNACFKGGVPTTLVFEKEIGEIHVGDCFDHFVIATKTSIEDLYSWLQQHDTKIFMKPTDMFGKKVMGLIDPNGYKVIIASTQ
jgi:catechol 2,3-dioxygenase-like lactoylglutathione lyase family enzyme